MKGLAAALLLLGAACLAGCGGHESAPEEKVFVLGDTTFNAENEEYGVDPRRGYSGWAAVRYGAGRPSSATPTTWSSRRGWRCRGSAPITARGASGSGRA